MPQLPIVIIDDDLDDRELLGDLSKELRGDHEIRYFVNGVEAAKYLETTSEQPFIILCDVNMPMMNGVTMLITSAKFVLPEKVIFFTISWICAAADAPSRPFNSPKSLLRIASPP